MNARSILAILALSFVSGAALAAGAQLPEPGVLELLAIGAVAGAVTTLRKRRK